MKVLPKILVKRCIVLQSLTLNYQDQSSINLGVYMLKKIRAFIYKFFGKMLLSKFWQIFMKKSAEDSSCKFQT